MKVGFGHGFLLLNASRIKDVFKIKVLKTSLSRIRCEELMEKENYDQIQLSLSNEDEVKQSGEENASAEPEPIRFRLVWSRPQLILAKMCRQSWVAMRAPTKNQIYFPYLADVFSA